MNELISNSRNIPFKWEADGRIDPHVTSTTQVFVAGTKLYKRGNRRFRYAFVGTGGLQSEFGACYSKKAIPNAVAPAQVGQAGTAGSFQVTITVGATAGVAGNGIIAVDELIGGTVVVGNGTNQHPDNRCILCNTSVASGGGACTLTLDDPLVTAVTVGTTNIETMMNPYGYLTSGNVTNSAYVTFLGMPAVTCAAGVWTWVQDRGPCWITSDGLTAAAASDRAVYFGPNGSVHSRTEITEGSHPVFQLAGYCIDASSSGSSNAPFVDLQLGS
jgi:hypothetical protein